MTVRVSPKALGIAVTLLVLAVYIPESRIDGTLIDAIEQQTYDMRLRASKSRQPKGDVVIAAIDEKSLSEIGRWPWDRNIQARVLKKLNQLGARIIASDVFFPESQNKQLLNLVRQLETEFPHTPTSRAYNKIKQSLNADSSLANTIKRSRNIVLSMVFLYHENETGHRTRKENATIFESVKNQAVGLIKDFGGGSLDFPNYRADPLEIDANVPAIQKAARYTGHINIFPDEDGVVRWAPLVIRYQGRFFPSADVQTVRAYLGVEKLVMTVDSRYGVIGLQIGDRFISTDDEGQMLINYHGKPNTFATYSIVDILHDRVPAEAIRGKIVLMGATAVGIRDVRSTPFDTAFPGPEIRANIMQNLIDGDYLKRPEEMILVDMLVLLILGLLLTFSLPRLGVRNGALFVIAILLAYITLAQYLLSHYQIWFNVTYPSLLLLSLFIATTIQNYVQAEHQKRQIKGAFQHYVAATVVDQIIDNIDQLQLGGEKRELTVLFSDIRGFTTLSESIAPEEMVSLLNTYLTRMTEQVFQHQGTLDKYIGDAIMAFYGAPVKLEDHAVLACRTALDMMRELYILQSHWAKEKKPVLDIGIGINTGPMIVGNMGSEDRFDYTVIGDAVNLGSRIESMNKIYGTNILISEFTYNCVRDEFIHIREIDIASVRGRQKPVGIYEMILSHNYDDLDWLPEFDKAYQLFRNKKIKKAEKIFEKLVVETADPVSQYYMMRCQNPRRRSGD